MDKNKFTVRVRFFGALAMYAADAEIIVEVENGCDLNSLLSRLLEINPPAYRDLLNQGNRKESFLRVMLNDSLVNEKDFGLLLSKGDLVTLIPAISGGAGKMERFY